MPLKIIRHDITKMNVGAIVNAANTALQMGGGVCGAIFKAAGADKLQAECDKIAPIKTGEAVITPGFALPAQYIIHTAGPVYRDGKHEEETLLRLCYQNSLQIAVENQCTSIAFPLISSGIYGYPKDDALRVATTTIQNFLLDLDIDIEVVLVVFDKAAFSLSKKLRGEIQSFIDENYISEAEYTALNRSLLHVKYDALATEEAAAPLLSPSKALPAGDFQLDEPFSATLLRLIDEKGKTDVEVYKRANIDRKLFSKVRNPGYRPGKKTAVALAIALELSPDETDDLLECAGFALSRSVLFDVIVDYFIRNGKYDIFEINNVLFDYDQPLLGA
jgi:O-acetyl-ADP-ribose deacetylase (regulator of RNase III)